MFTEPTLLNQSLARRSADGETFWPDCVPGRKPLAMFLWQKCVLQGFPNEISVAKDYRLGQYAGAIILRCSRCCEARERFAVVPRHPCRRVREQFCGMAQQFRKVIERVNSIQLTSVNQTHEQIACVRSI